MDTLIRIPLSRCGAGAPQSSGVDRRRFLGFAAAAGGALAAGLIAREARADTSGYRALVAVFLYGGNDAFNMVVPRSDAEYAVYAASRQNLAVPQSALLPIAPLTPDGASWGLHPSMSGVQRLFAAHRLAVVASTGPLVVPATKAEVLARSVDLPPQLFSHNDQQDQWQTLDGGVAVGDRLCLHALAGINHQDRALTGGQRAADFIGEVDVAGSIDEVQLVGLTVLRRVVQGHAVRLDGDAALTLQVHGVQDLGFHLAVGQAATDLDEAVGQGRLAMIDVGDDGKIADMTQVTHGSTLEKAAGRLPAEK